MQVSVLLFGPAAASAGRDSLTVSLLMGASCLDVLVAIGMAEPRLKPMVDPLNGARLAVNHAFAPVSQTVRPTDEIALITMVSGG